MFKIKFCTFTLIFVFDSQLITATAEQRGLIVTSSGHD